MKKIEKEIKLKINNIDNDRINKKVNDEQQIPNDIKKGKQKNLMLNLFIKKK